METCKRKGDPMDRAFGFDPTDSQHHFLITIDDVKATFSEHYNYPSTAGGELRVILPRNKWDLIAAELRAEFNRRFQSQSKILGKWSLGPNYLARIIGKETILLAWAIEDADPSLIPNAIVNWKGLAPEERWWLYTQTAAVTRGVNDKDRGWRKAIRFALTEN